MKAFLILTAELLGLLCIYALASCSWQDAVTAPISLGIAARDGIDNIVHPTPTPYEDHAR